MLSTLFINVFSLQVFTKWNILSTQWKPRTILSNSIQFKLKKKNPRRIENNTNYFVSPINRHWVQNIEVIDIMRTILKLLKRNHHEHQRILYVALKVQLILAVKHPQYLHQNLDTIELLLSQRNYYSRATSDQRPAQATTSHRMIHFWFYVY